MHEPTPIRRSRLAGSLERPESQSSKSARSGRVRNTSLSSHKRSPATNPQWVQSDPFPSLHDDKPPNREYGHEPIIFAVVEPVAGA